MFSYLLAHAEAILAVVVQGVIVPVRDFFEASIPMVRSLHITLAPALWGAIQLSWIRYVRKKCPDPPPHPDDWPNKNHGHRPTCKYLWDNWVELRASEDDVTFDSILKKAIQRYNESRETRGQVPKSAVKLRESLERLGLTEEKLKQWPSPDSVRGPYLRKRAMQAAGFGLAAIVVLAVTAIFAVAYRSLDTVAAGN